MKRSTAAILLMLSLLLPGCGASPRETLPSAAGGKTVSTSSGDVASSESAPPPVAEQTPSSEGDPNSVHPIAKFTAAGFVCKSIKVVGVGIQCFHEKGWEIEGQLLGNATFAERHSEMIKSQREVSSGVMCADTRVMYDGGKEMAGLQCWTQIRPGITLDIDWYGAREDGKTFDHEKPVGVSEAAFVEVLLAAKVNTRN